jgi:hypothetical protein
MNSANIFYWYFARTGLIDLVLKGVLVGFAGHALYNSFRKPDLVATALARLWLMTILIGAWELYFLRGILTTTWGIMVEMTRAFSMTFAVSAGLTSLVLLKLLVSDHNSRRRSINAAFLAVTLSAVAFLIVWGKLQFLGLSQLKDRF